MLAVPLGALYKGSAFVGRAVQRKAFPSEKYGLLCGEKYDLFARWASSTLAPFKADGLVYALPPFSVTTADITRLKRPFPPPPLTPHRH